MIYSMYVMVLLTFIVGIITITARIKSVKSGAVNPRDYRLMEAKFPARVQVTTRCFNNLFELPTLFYVGALAYIVTGNSHSLVGLLLAWTFVGLRIVQAGIHLTYNHLLHRMAVFWLAMFTLIALWTNLILLVNGR